MCLLPDSPWVRQGSDSRVFGRRCSSHTSHFGSRVQQLVEPLKREEREPSVEVNGAQSPHVPAEQRSERSGCLAHIRFTQVSLREVFLLGKDATWTGCTALSSRCGSPGPGRPVVSRTAIAGLSTLWKPHLQV